MKKKILTISLATGLMFLFTACNGNEAPEGTNNKDEKVVEQEQSKPNNTKQNSDRSNQADKNQSSDKKEINDVPELPKQKVVKMMVEGMEEDETLYLKQSAELGLSMYLPENMIAETEQNSITAYFKTADGAKNENVQVKISKSSKDSIQSAIENIKSELAKFEFNAIEDKRFDFSEQEFSIQNKTSVGMVSVFKQNNQIYTMVAHYPGEYGDGFEPRLDLIMKELVWHH